MHRAFIALEVLNATGNVALNLASSQLSGTPFETLVHNTDMMLLGFGIKNIAKDALPAMYDLAKNGDGIVNAQSVKMFLASFFSIETSVRTAALSGDVGAKNISAVADAVIADVKNHPNGNSLIAEAKTFIGITRFNAYNLGNLGVKGISKRGTIEISGIAFNDADNIVDVIIHAKGTGYSLWIDKVEQVITEADLATLLGNIPSGKIIRLLSCSDLNSAKKISEALNRPIIASKGKVTIFENGKIDTDDNSWFTVSNAGQTPAPTAHIPTASTPAEKQSNLKRIMLGDEVEIFFENVLWKKGKSIWKSGKLSEHYKKHVTLLKEFGEISMDDYHNLMEIFLKEVNATFTEVKIGNQLIKYDPNTERILIGHIKDREIKSFYKALPEFITQDPLLDAINLALKETGLSQADIIYK